MKLEMSEKEIDACIECLDYNASEGDFENRLAKKLCRIKLENKVSKE